MKVGAYQIYGKSETFATKISISTDAEGGCCHAVTEGIVIQREECLQMQEL